jgi:hypothetical protein
MDELKRFLQENQPAIERHVGPAAAMIKNLTAGVCAAGGTAN